MRQNGAGEYCPFYVGKIAPPEVDLNTANAAVEYSRKANAESVLQEALETSAFSRKTILVGDSLTRQTYITIGCMLHKFGVIDGERDSYIAWQNDKHENNPDKMFRDARIRFKWKGELNEIFYHPTAGRINEFGWNYYMQAGPLKGTENWLESCQKREPFFLDTYKLKKKHHGPHLSVLFNDRDFEKVRLDRNDVVIINAGFHPTGRKRNLQRIAQLADCMNEARSRGEGQNWPMIRYMRTSQQHFASENSNYDKESSGSPCREAENGQDPYYLEDLEYMEGKLPVLGKKINFKNLYHLHIGEKANGKTDCSHWAMPGVPNMFAKVVMKSLINQNDGKMLEN